MDTIVETVLQWALTLAKAYPPAAAVLGVLASLAGVVILFQKPIGKFVRETKTTKDDGFWHWVLIGANVLTPNGSRIGEDIEAEPVSLPVVNPETHITGDPGDEPTEN